MYLFEDKEWLACWCSSSGNTEITGWNQDSLKQLKTDVVYNLFVIIKNEKCIPSLTASFLFMFLNSLFRALRIDTLVRRHCLMMRIGIEGLIRVRGFVLEQVLRVCNLLLYLCPVAQVLPQSMTPVSKKQNAFTTCPTNSPE